MHEENRVRPAASEVERLCANATKAESKLGWKPDYAGRDGFLRGLEQTIAWMLERHDNLWRFKTKRYEI